MSRRRRTAFVFSGGASLGALQAGMLRALYDERVSADLLVGTSAGALNAAFVASRPQVVATARRNVQPMDFGHAARLTADALSACREVLSAPYERARAA
jgi:predicted acylesterase/phospholipase RssA